MSDQTRDLILRHWSLANARDWTAFADLLAPHMRYDVPQTREYIDGAVGYLDLFRTWTGDWRATVTSLVCEQSKAICIVDFAVGADVMTGISVIDVDAGTIVKVVDYWPDPYDPPPRASRHMKRAAPS